MKATSIKEKQRRKAYYQANKAKLKAYQKTRYEKIKSAKINQQKYE